MLTDVSEHWVTTPFASVRNPEYTPGEERYRFGTAGLTAEQVCAL